MKALIESTTNYFRALQVVRKYKLWWWIILPGIFFLLLLAAGVVLGRYFGDHIGDWVANYWPWEWGVDGVNTIVDVIAGVAIFIVPFFIFKYLILIFGGPFMSMLSEKVSEKVTGQKSNQVFHASDVASSVIRGARLAMRNMFREVALTLVAFSLGFFPLFAPLSAGLIFIIGAYYAGFGNHDFALERYTDFRGSITYNWKHRASTLGNGIAFQALLMIPFVGAFIAPTLGTIAATLSVLKRIDPPVSDQALI